MYVANINCSLLSHNHVVHFATYNIYFHTFCIKSTYIHVYSTQGAVMQGTCKCDLVAIYDCNSKKRIGTYKVEILMQIMHVTVHGSEMYTVTLYVTTTLPACKLWSFTFILYLWWCLPCFWDFSTRLLILVHFRAHNPV